MKGPGATLIYAAAILAGLVLLARQFNLQQPAGLTLGQAWSQWFQGAQATLGGAFLPPPSAGYEWRQGFSGQWVQVPTGSSIMF